LILYRVMETLKPVPGNSGHYAVYTLDGVAINLIAQALTHLHTMGSLEMPVRLICMSLDSGRQERRQPTKHEENMQTPHTDLKLFSQFSPNCITCHTPAKFQTAALAVSHGSMTPSKPILLLLDRPVCLGFVGSAQKREKQQSQEGGKR
ncbi:4-hydroxyproline 2-epimerase, partial [Clarias magur]